MDNIVLSVNIGEGIGYSDGSSGKIVNSTFSDSRNISHVLSVNGNVDIVNSEFRGNNLTGSAVYYGESGSGNISNSSFYGNVASSDVRNININNITKVIVKDNNIDAYLKEMNKHKIIM